ncbi:MAG: response regulator [Gammaproteobacteria bacterium]|nr:response regulator [Gammaproteobacteria bacterium]
MNENPKHILHVEDDVSVQKYISTLISGLARVTSVSTLRDAQARVKETRYDLIIIDFTLPDGSGSELIGQLAKQDPSIPIIVFSAHEIANTMLNVKQTFLKNRYSPKIFLDTVTKYLGNT